MRARFPVATLRRMDPGGSRSLSQLRRGVLEFCVLALLDRRQMYAFDLVRGLSETDSLVVGEGTVYPLLSRMRRDGWVSTTWVESTAGPPRRYYALTAAGRAELLAFTASWRAFTAGVDALLPAETA